MKHLALLLVVGAVAFACTGAGGGAEDCADGEARCAADALENCQEGEWVVWDDCEVRGEVCSVQGGVIQCLPGGDGTDPLDTETVDTGGNDTSSGADTESDTLLDTETVDTETVDTDSETDSAVDTGTGTGTDTGTGTGVDTGTGTGTDTGTGTGVDTGTGTGTDTGTGTGVDTDTVDTDTVDTDTVDTDTTPPVTCATGPCDVNASCDDSGAMIVCTCNSGWTGDGIACADVDECAQDLDDCDDVNGTCTDNDGSFTCGCDPGYHLGTGTTCVIDAVCTDDATRVGSSVCGLNNNGFYGQLCVAGQWEDTATCYDVDVCTNSALQPGSSPCGLNNVGVYQQVCTDGQWEDTLTCLDPDDCVNTTTQPGTTVCGINMAGVLEQLCTGGQWGDTGNCIDDDVCFNTDEQPGMTPCGINLDGRLDEVCVDGAWEDTANCVDDDICLNGQFQSGSTACGLNLDGLLDEVCVNGDWVDGTNCVDDDICTNTTTQPGSTPCGINMAGLLDEVCVDGTWEDDTTCVDDDECLNGALQDGTTDCGNSGVFEQLCTDGTWGDTANCVDDGVCVNGALQVGTTTCENIGTLEQECVDGQWADTTDCLLGNPFYEPTSLFADPQQFADMIPGFADFWISAQDTQDGGFYTYVDIAGNPTANTRKSVVGQSRDAWGFSKAFMLTGQESYLDYAEHALAFNYAHAWDTANDGWFYELTDTGTPTTYWANNVKWSFGQHYALLGIAGMVEATQDPYHKGWLMQGWNSNENHMWDNDPVEYGYYAEADRDWSNPTGKGFTPTADGITTNVLSMYIGANEPIGQTRMGQLGNNMYDHFITSADARVAFGFGEDYYTNWNLDETSTFGFVGHVLKTAWCMARAHLVTGRTQGDWVDRAAEYLLDVWNNGGYDHTYGGPFSTMDWESGYINQDEKEYWQVEQAITAGLMNFHVNSDAGNQTIFLQMAEESMQFFLDYFVDYTNGEIYKLTEPDGTLLSATKGDIYKSAYHGIETLYYGYVYGSFFYNHSPVELYYRFLPQSAPLAVKLTPCAIEDDRLAITGVERDGVPYGNYDGATRILTVPAGEGGIFKVTYEVVP